MDLLTRHDEGIWIAAFPHRMMGLEIGTRTTIVRLGSGGLAVISPGPLRDEHFEALRALGEVEALIAPNTFHHLFVGHAARAFPSAQLFFAPGLASKVRDLPSGDELALQAPSLWRGTLEQTVVLGSNANEVVFFHPASRTLILTDLAFNIRRGGLWTRIGMTLNGGFGKFGPTKVMRSTIHDRPAFARSIQAIARWDFDRIILAHGDLVEADGRAAFLAAFAPYLQADVEMSRGT